MGTTAFVQGSHLNIASRSWYRLKILRSIHTSYLPKTRRVHHSHFVKPHNPFLILIIFFAHGSLWPHIGLEFPCCSYQDIPNPESTLITGSGDEI